MGHAASTSRAAAWGIVCLLAATSGTPAKDVRRQWFVGGSLAYHTTQDAVANNASMPGDPRPDDYSSRELTLDDTIQFGLHGGYGFTSSFSVQLDAGWFQGDAGSVDQYLIERYPASTDPVNPYNLNLTVNSSTSHPFTAGTLKQFPVGLTGVYRFRKDSTFNPFVGIGAGVIFMEFDDTDEMLWTNGQLEQHHTYSVTDEHGAELLPDFVKASVAADGAQLLFYGLTTDVGTAREWHLSTGVEYAIRDRLGLVVEVRYTFVDTPLRLNLNGRFQVQGRVYPVTYTLGPEDQVTYAFHPDQLYRPDGSVLIYNDSRRAPNPINPHDPLFRRYGCEGPGEGPPGGPGEAVDINSDGLVDMCYHDKDTADDDPFGRLVIQGGELDLSGFNVQLGLRWYF